MSMMTTTQGTKVTTVRPVQSSSPPVIGDDHVHDMDATKARCVVRWRRVFRKFVAIRKAAVAPAEPQNRVVAARWALIVLTAAKDASIKKLTFLQTFGALGPPMLAVVVISIVWTSWLLFLAVAPTRTANFLMDTETFDDGRFWLIVEYDAVTVVLSTAGLLTVGIAYLYILLTMLLWQKGLSRVSRVTRVTGKLYSKLSANDLLKAFRFCRVKCFETTIEQWRELTGFEGAHRKYWVRSRVCVLSSLPVAHYLLV